MQVNILAVFIFFKPPGTTGFPQLWKRKNVFDDIVLIFDDIRLAAPAKSYYTL